MPPCTPPPLLVKPFHTAAITLLTVLCAAFAALTGLVALLWLAFAGDDPSTSQVFVYGVLLLLVVWCAVSVLGPFLAFGSLRRGRILLAYIEASIPIVPYVALAVFLMR